MNIHSQAVTKQTDFASLKDRVVIITGAGQGIGKVFAKAFAQCGAIPVIAERNATTGEAVAKEIEASGGRVLAVTTDVSREDSIAAVIEAVESRFGRIDVLINNAGIFSTLEMRPFDQIPVEEWERVLRVNVTGPFLCSRAVLPSMRRAKWGRIINMASGAVTMGRPNYLHYIASKGALAGMTGSMARELGADGITVNAILPGATFTEIERKTVSPEQKVRIVAQQCIPRAETPDDLVGTALFLASDSSAFLTGQCLTVDGGATHR
jgi:NAD(P)-dependent dehydrogenase (short-subunit alcohol dehydrogenase family)